jgi:SAM-dependent methyltransferase
MQAMDLTSTSYDEVLYPAGLFPQTHPDRLATTAYLRGLSPAPIQRCRVLELGCGAANNLVAMAFQLPESEFVGVDAARIPIASGQSLAAELGLRNMTLRAMDLCDRNLEKFGTFDFIVAHGVYSWVPDFVRERILQICRDMLAKEGIGYVSYNAYPGCHFRDLVRHMMCFHTQKFEGVSEKATQARALVKFMAESRKKPDYYTEAFHTQLGRIVKYGDESLYHDDLNPFAQPFYFHEFMEEAQRHDLQYVGEAVLDSSDRAQFTPEALQRMRELDAANEIVREQYKDFLCGTGFRQTLLCKRELQLAAAFLEERIPDLFAMCDSVPLTDPETAGDSPVEFKTPGGGKFEISNPVWRTALCYICSQWPCAVSFEQILNEVRRRDPKNFTDSGSATEGAFIASALKESYALGVVSLRIRPPNVVNQVGERPAISRLAQAQIRLGGSIASQLHASMKVPDAAGRHFLSLLDGTRDVEALAAEMIAFTRSSGQDLLPGETDDRENLEEKVRQRVKNNLVSLMRGGMFVA